jgi:ABC-type amino acid transport substrate-binding protein
LDIRKRAHRIWQGIVFFGTIVNRVATAPACLAHKKEVDTMTLTKRLLSPIPLLAFLMVIAVAAGLSIVPDATAAEECPDEPVLERIKRTSALVIGAGSYPPGVFVDPKKGEWTGFDIDFYNELAARLGVDPYVTYMPGSALVPATKTGRIDVIVDLYKNPKRAQVIDFSDPWIYYFDNVYVNSENPTITEPTVAALSGKRVTTCRGCGEEAYIDRIPGATKVLFDKVEEGFLELSAGRVDAAIQPSIYGDYGLARNPDWKIKSIGPPPKEWLGEADLYATPSYFGFVKGPCTETLKKEINALIAEWRETGKLKETLAKYGMTDPAFMKGLE